MVNPNGYLTDGDLESTPLAGRHPLSHQGKDSDEESESNPDKIPEILEKILRNLRLRKIMRMMAGSETGIGSSSHSSRKRKL